MPKLLVTVDAQFKTNALLVTDKESFEEVSLDAAKGKAFFEKVPSDELAFEIVSTNEDTGASFPFTLKNGKKGAIFEVQLIEGGKFLQTKISGVFAVDLRPGVADMLKNVGANLDLRIRGVMWKGGAYQGFMASVAGGDYEQNSTDWSLTFPQVTNFEIK